VPLTGWVANHGVTLDGLAATLNVVVAAVVGVLTRSRR
jgi:hypothetical protein